MVLGGKTTEKSLRDSVWNALLIGKQNEIASIAFPAIGTGIAGFPLEECAKIMFECFHQFSNLNNKDYESIQVVLFSNIDYQKFKDIFEEKFNEFQ